MARWVVAADGGSSLVRSEAGVAFQGGEYEYEQDFVLADVRMNWPLDRAEVDLFFAAEGLVVVAPLPEGRFRIVATVQSAPEQPPAELFERIPRQRGPSEAVIRIGEIIWSSRFHLHHRVASAMRSGRILLAGDAAHVYSPAGGQGMNTGIQDAISLAGPLMRAVRHDDDQLLQQWEQIRLSVAQEVVSLTDHTTRVATLDSWPTQMLRNAAVGLMGKLPPLQHAAAETLSELVYR